MIIRATLEHYLSGFPLWGYPQYTVEVRQTLLGPFYTIEARERDGQVSVMWKRVQP